MNLMQEDVQKLQEEFEVREGAFFELVSALADRDQQDGEGRKLDRRHETGTGLERVGHGAVHTG